MPETLFEPRFIGILAVLFLAGLVSTRVLRVWRRSRLEREVDHLSETLGEHVSTHFTIQPCFRCYESQWEFLRVSERGRSVECCCTCCGKKQWAPAATPESSQILEILDALEERTESYRRMGDGSLEIPPVLAGGPDAPLPFEQTTRAHIPESLSGQVWRRDGGACVSCGTKQNLQFDHLIPVSRGGATTVKNLQLLCQSCNASKGTRI